MYIYNIIIDIIVCTYICLRVFIRYYSIPPSRPLNLNPRQPHKCRQPYVNPKTMAPKEAGDDHRAVPGCSVLAEHWFESSLHVLPSTGFRVVGFRARVVTG